ncbi:putative chloride channel, voltage gated [Medicago truncatula]|nr:putative chloride channel, voltage gated [Medicago truncatula]
MRTTVSLCVIMLELTNNLLLLPLIMMVLVVSKSVANVFNANVYDLIMKAKGLPYLETNASPYTVVETMSLAKALILFREVGLRHLLVIPGRSPVVAILTRHDFTPEHILGMHPFPVKSRWKRLRFSQTFLEKILSGI